MVQPRRAGQSGSGEFLVIDGHEETWGDVKLPGGKRVGSERTAIGRGLSATDLSLPINGSPKPHAVLLGLLPLAPRAPDWKSDSRGFGLARSVIHLPEWEVDHRSLLLPGSADTRRRLRRGRTFLPSGSRAL